MDLIRIKFLGTIGEGVQPKNENRRHPGILISYKEKKLMLDCGDSQFLKEKPDWIFLSHGHPDHVEGLRKGSHYKVFLTAETLKLIKEFPMEDITIIKPNEKYFINDFEITTFPTFHSTKAPSIGFKVKIGDKILIYTSDTLWIRNREKIFRNAFLLIGDGSAYNQDLVRKEKKTGKPVGHAGLLRIYRWAKDAGIPNVIFTNLGNWIHKIDPILAFEKIDASPVFDGSEVIIRNNEIFSIPARRLRGREKPPASYPKDRKFYADPLNWKYPLSTRHFAKKAYEYFRLRRNYMKYTKLERRYIRSSIIEAWKKLGLGMAEFSKAKRWVIQNHWRGASVSDRTPIIIRKDSKVSVIPIKDLFTYSEAEKQLLTEKEIDGIETWTKSGWSKIKYVMRHKQNSPLKRILIHEGLIEVSDDHSLFNESGPVKVSSLKKGDLIAELPLPVLDGKLSVDPDIAWLYGFYLAEGNSHRTCIEFANADLSLLRKAKAIGDKLGLKTSILSDGKDGYKLSINWPIGWLFQTLGVHEVSERKARWKIVPSVVFSWDKKSQRAFLEGYFDGDGIRINYKKNSIEWASSSQSVAQGILLISKRVFNFQNFLIGLQDSVIRVKIVGAHNLLQKDRNKIKGIFKAKASRNYGEFNANYKDGSFAKVHYPSKGEWYYSNKRWIYDVETENHDFLAGVGRIQAHNSVHGDLRFEWNGYLIGFTLANQEDVSKEIVGKHWKLEKDKGIVRSYFDGELFYEVNEKTGEVIKDAPKSLKDKVFHFYKSLIKDKRLWKIDQETGEELTRPAPKGKEGTRAKIWAAEKAREPGEWLTVEGVTKPREIEEVPGGTRFYPGVFTIVDTGTYYLGAQKPYYREFFLNGKKWIGRIVLRQVAGLKEGKRKLQWLFWKPDSQIPYVIDKRAIKENWLPKSGSAMPPEWENKIPKEFRFWLKKSRKEKLLARAEAVNYLIENGILKGRRKIKIEGRDFRKGKFILTERNWKGPVIIRNVPVSDYHIKINGYQFHLDKSPLWKDEISAATFTGELGFFQEGKKEPQTAYNPNKKIPAFVKILDSGPCRIIDENPNSIKVEFLGKKLKDQWVFLRTSPKDPVWSMVKSLQPKSFNFMFKDFSKLTEVKTSRDLKFPYLFRGVAFAEGTWHEELYPWKVIKKAAPSIVGAPLVLDHKDSGILDTIGEVRNYRLNEDKKWLEFEGVIYDTEKGKDTALLIENKKIGGISVRMTDSFFYNTQGKKEAQEILDWVHVSFVPEPEVSIAKVLT